MINLSYDHLAFSVLSTVMLTQTTSMAISFITGVTIAQVIQAIACQFFAKCIMIENN